MNSVPHTARLCGFLLLAILAPGQDVETISCTFPFQSAEVHIGTTKLACNFSSLAPFLPRVFINGTLLSISEYLHHNACDIIYLVPILQRHDGLEIAVSYGSSALGRWTTTILLPLPSLTSVTPQLPVSTYRMPRETVNPSIDYGSDGADSIFIWIAVPALIVLIAITGCLVLVTLCVWKNRRKCTKRSTNDSSADTKNENGSMEDAEDKQSVDSSESLLAQQNQPRQSRRGFQ